MASWNEVATAAPELTRRAKELFDAHRHKVMATLRLDGSPRVSGIELDFRDGDVWLGSMPHARKGQDLRRDPRVALHSTSDDPNDDDPGAWPGDAKIGGRAIHVTDPAIIEVFAKDAPPGGFDLFRIDVSELVVTRVGEPPDHLIIEAWTEDGGPKRFERK